MSAETERLPYVDEHEATIEADRETTWQALLHVAEAAVSGAGAPRYARLVGCADTEASGPRPLAAGSRFPGFHVATAEQPAELGLAGSHRFSDYALVFRLEERPGGRTRLRPRPGPSFPVSRAPLTGPW